MGLLSELNSVKSIPLALFNSVKQVGYNVELILEPSTIKCLPAATAVCLPEMSSDDGREIAISSLPVT